MTYISKDQGNFDLSVHDPFKQIKDYYREWNILGLVQVKLSQQHLWHKVDYHKKVFLTHPSFS